MMHRLLRTVSYCTFCNIIAGSEWGDILHDEDEVLVFRNRLRWVPTMLLTVPKRHLSQEELWSNLGAVGRAAVEMGRRHCPNGFRLVSNFGWDALQSQPHAHVHVLGGGSMNEVALVDPEAESEVVLEQHGFRVSRLRSQWPPVVLLAEPHEGSEPGSLWENLGEIGSELVKLGNQLCPYGFRFVSNFGWDALQTLSNGHLYLLGGGELGHYV
jgi:histidine triad (HIT) family protein